VISFLEDYTVLPFEGATRGKDLLREACIRSAIEFLEARKYKKTIQLVDKAKLWPANLGVGRPYDVDERLEDNILVLAYAAKRDKANSAEYIDKVMNYEHPEYKNENSRLYLQLKLLKENGKVEEAEKLLARFLKENPGSNYLKWVEAKFKNSSAAKQLENEIMQDSGSSLPFDPKYIDRNFELLVDFLEVIEK
jgi:tetratricopeptide (TPR) repeat protein